MLRKLAYMQFTMEHLSTVVSARQAILNCSLVLKSGGFNAHKLISTFLHHHHQSLNSEVFVWSNCMLDLGMDFLFVTWSLYEMCSISLLLTK